ncbi:hypothetical protein OESDEN_08993 [Oesophagostomum dentatum]|uniref:Uncharacterized protein n=1 Tax=Oesophagostomum dentatum TaxID=61180 RepID=A0A0B1T5W4_OESDE|nr:hypothetical protein OESDEN_08993 [Oesophagostomum dentatum]
MRDSFTNALDYIKVKCTYEMARLTVISTHLSSWIAMECLPRNGLRRRKRKFIRLSKRHMYSYIVGVNEFHNPGVLRVKQGTFMKTVMSQLRSQWTEFEQTGHIRKKFTAYSTQDWLILAFLHSLGCGESVLGRTVPNYNALIIIELYVRNKEPVIKLLYKDNEMKTPKEAVQHVRNCKSSPCHLEEFTSCCSEYESENPTETCAVG